jgi:hypothetical protein
VQDKVVLRQAANNLAVFVANSNRESDQLDVDGDIGGAIVLRSLAHARKSGEQRDQQARR